MKKVTNIKMSTSCAKKCDPPSYHHDVTVIGAGWSGVASCKYMLEEGLSVVALESRDDIGGVWFYSDDPSLTTVMKTTHCTSSSTVTELSDFPMPQEIGMFPKHTDVLRYLHSYVDRFRLRPHIRFNTSVRSVERRGREWWVECENGDTYNSSYLVVASGVNHVPNRELETTILKGFTGKIYHAIEIKEPKEEHRGERLLVVGGGETGSDICMDWHNHSQFTYWSIPRGQHFFRKYGKVVPWGKLQALDKASSRMMKMIAPYHRNKPGLAWICKWTTAGSLLAYQGHGIPEWRNKSPFFNFVINKSGKVLDHIDYKRLVPKAGIEECNGKEVVFSDGSRQEFDLIIMSTGYKTCYPFLPKHFAEVRIRKRYKFVFDVEEPSLAFVGLVRPIVGSMVGIIELQARCAAKVFSQKVPLKTLDERLAEVENDDAFWNNYFMQSSQRIEGLVEGFTYIDDIARLANIYPDYWELFKRNPRHWYIAYFSPYNGATYRLNEPKNEEQAIATMQSHRQATLSPVHLLLIVFLRLIWLDWFLNILGTLKYRIQASRWWVRAREWRVTKAANWLWTLPKRTLFDKTQPCNDV